VNLPSIKRASSPHYTEIGLKTLIRSATYGPKARQPTYRDLGALSTPNLCSSVRHIALSRRETLLDQIGVYGSASVLVEWRATVKGYSGASYLALPPNLVALACGLMD
jgi:hypothetical protein